MGKKEKKNHTGFSELLTFSTIRTTRKTGNHQDPVPAMNNNKKCMQKNTQISIL